MNSLGWVLEWGLGVPRDMEQAKQWYQKAAALGSKDGKMNLANIGRGRLNASKDTRLISRGSSSNSPMDCPVQCLNWAEVNGVNQCVNEGPIC